MKTLLAVFLVVTILMPLHARTPTVRKHPSHSLMFSLSGEHEIFAARIDGRKFSSVATLENYLAQLPAGDEVECFLGLPGMGPARYDQTFKDYLKIQRELSDFCSKHKIDYEGGISTD